MTNTDIKNPAMLRAWTQNALTAVRAAGEGLAAAKRTRSLPLIACAQGELQAAVDVARDLDVEWGEIGSALGIARGNAYQKFRKKPSARDYRYGRDARAVRYPA